MKGLPIKKIFDKTFYKFIVVGIANTLFGTAIMFIFYNILHINYWVSSASNYLFGSILSYILNKYFTFQNKEKSSKVLIKFIVNISLCYFIAYGAAKPLISYLLSNYNEMIRDNIAMLVGMGLFVILNYISQRYITFK